MNEKYLNSPLAQLAQPNSLMDLTTPPAVLKKFIRICKLASESEETDPVVTYYCRLYVASMGLTPEFNSKESREYVTKLLDYLDEAKKNNAGDPLYSEEALGLKYLERKGLELFTEAFRKDEAGDFGAATIAGFLNSASILEVLTLREETSEEITNARKYAKYKVLYLIDCKKRGKKPVAGPLTEGDASVAPNIAGLHDDHPLPPPPTTSGEPSPKPSRPAPQQHHDESDSHHHAVANSSTDVNNKDRLSSEVCEKAIKAAKFAISSLQYKDRAAAVRYLNEALQLIQG